MNFKKPILFLALCLFIMTSVLAQKPNIHWGPDYSSSKAFFTKIIPIQGTDAGYYSVAIKPPNRYLSNSAEKLLISKFDNSLKLKKEVKNDLKYKGKVRKLEDILQIKNEMYAITSFHNRKKEINYLFAQKINSNLKLAKNLKKIGEIPTRNILNEGNFDVVFSSDSSKVLVYNDLPYKKGEPEQFAFNIYDNEFNPIWKKKIRLPFNDEDFKIEKYRIDNNGNVYVLGVIYKDKSKSRRRGTANYEYVILSYTNHGTERKTYKLGLKEKFISDLTFKIGKDGNLICSGFYSEKGTYSIKGSYFFRVNTETEVIFNENFKEFDFDFLTVHFSKRKKRRAQKAIQKDNKSKEPELYNYYLDDLIIRSDGGALLIAEQYNTYTQYVQDFGTFNATPSYRTVTHYYYNDIILVNIDPKGEIEWTARIPKWQHTINDFGRHSSYKKVILKDRLVFLFNDINGKTENESGLFSRFKGKGAMLEMATVTFDGVVDVQPMFQNREIGMMAVPKKFTQISKNEVILYADSFRKFKFAKLIIE